MKIILLFILLTSIYSNIKSDDVLITTYHNLNLVKNEIAKEINSIYDFMNLTTTFQNFTETDTWLFKPEILNITNIEFVLNKNVTKISNVELKDESTILINGPIFNITLQFDYSYSCWTTDKSQGSLVLQANNYNFLRSYNFTDDHKQLLGAVNFDFVFDKVKLNGKFKDDSEVLEMANKGFTKAVQNEILNKIKTRMNSEIQRYYDTTNTKEVFTLKSKIPNKEYTFTNSEELHAKNLQNGVVYYINSKLNNNGSIGNKLGYLEHFNNYNTNTAATWDSFNEADGVYQLFIHYNNLENVLSAMSSNNEFTFNINQSDIPKNLPFDMDVEALGRVYPGIIIDNCLIYFNFK